MVETEMKEWDLLERQYQHSSENVFVFAADGTLLWENRPCTTLEALLKESELFTRKDEKKSMQKMSLICHQGSLYVMQTEQFMVDQQEAYLLRVSNETLQQLEWQNEDWRHEKENRIAFLRASIFEISNMLHSICDTIEQCGESYSPLIESEQLQYLDKIQATCTKLMRPAILELEQMRYYLHQDTACEMLFLDREMADFVERSQQYLGRSICLSQFGESHLPIYMNPRRFQFFLLCLLVHFYYLDHTLSYLAYHIQQEGDEILFVCSATQSSVNRALNAKEDAPEELKTDLLAPEETILHMFCQEFHINMIFSKTDQRTECAMRFPVYNPEEENKVAYTFDSKTEDMNSDVFSPYHVLLSKVTPYRYY